VCGRSFARAREIAALMRRRVRVDWETGGAADDQA
jgi:hypothetical protein